MRIYLTLFCLSLVLGFTLLNYGGATPGEWNTTLIALCGVSLVFWFSPGAGNDPPPVSRPVVILAAALLAYVGMQLLPLPVTWLSELSPARAEILRGLAPFHKSDWAALSVSPQLTFAQLIRLLAYLQVYFLARELGAEMAGRSWLAALPLLLLASAESAIGLAQHFETGGFATGTYKNHGHLSGLLELGLPLALMLILLPFRPERREGFVSGSGAVQICAAGRVRGPPDPGPCLYGSPHGPGSRVRVGGDSGVIGAERRTRTNAGRFTWCLCRRCAAAFRPPYPHHPLRRRSDG